MKHILPLLLALACLLLSSQALAQIDVRLDPIRKEYLLGESVALKLTLTNRTDRSVVLSNIPGRCWLSFTVTQSGDNNPISPKALARYPKLELPPGSKRSFQVNLRPYYRFNRANNYKAIATVRMPDMETTYSSNRASFSLSFGGNIRSYAVQAGGQNLQMCVKLMHVDKSDYVFGQVLNNDTREALGACVVGKYLRFMQPIAMLDRQQNLHILCQSTPEFFSYAVMGTDGKRRQHGVYKRTGGPVDLVSTGSGVRPVGLAPYVPPAPGKEGEHSASDRPF